MPWYKSKYFLAFIVALIVGLFGAAQQFVVEIATTYPAEARIAGALLIGLALFVEILPKPSQIVQPIVSTENVETVNVQQPAPIDIPPDDRPAVATKPRAVPRHD
jgi:hypothetical protein